MVKTTVIFYQLKDGQSPVVEFLDSLSDKQTAKVTRILTSIKTYGLLSVLPHVKKLTGIPLWEIRIVGQDNIRIFYIVPQKECVLLLHGFIKKTQKTSIQEINTALRRL